jgi:hypothetical protein
MKKRLAELTGRGGAGKAVSKQMVGLESYDINNSPKYLTKFGCQSEYMSILKPNDYIIAKRTADVSRRRSSAAVTTTQRRIGVTGQMSNVSEIAHGAAVRFERNAHAAQVEALLEYCLPTKDHNGRWMRKQYHYYSNEDFGTQIENVNVAEANLKLPDI